MIIQNTATGKVYLLVNLTLIELSGAVNHSVPVLEVGASDYAEIVSALGN